MKLIIKTTTKSETETTSNVVKLENEETINTGADLFNILALVFKSNGPVFEPRQGVPTLKPDPDEAFVANELDSLPELVVEEKPKAAPKNPSPSSNMPSWKPGPEGFTISKNMTRGSILDTFEVVTPEQMASTIEEKPEPIKRTTELIGAKSTGFTLEERLEDEDPNRRVKVWVNCVSCDFEGAKGTRLGDRDYKCPSCRQRLFLRDATEVHGAKDEEGYVLLAQDKFLTREELYYLNLENESN